MKRRAALIVAATLVLILVAGPIALGKNRGTDIWGNLGGANPAGDDFPLTNYSLDSYVDAGLTDGPVAWAMASLHALASLIWAATIFGIDLTISVFGWAFSMFLLDSDTGIVQPVAAAAQSMHADVLGAGWTMTAILVLGVWALFNVRNQGLVYRGLAASACMAMVALALINGKAETFTAVAGVAHRVSVGLLSGVSQGTVGNPGGAEKVVADHMHDVWIARPWMVLDFAGLSHCVDTDRLDSDGFPRPVNPHDPSRDVCRDNARYAKAYLATPSGTDEREAVYQKIKSGEAPWDKADAPAVDIQQEAAAPQRFILAAMIGFASLGVILVVGGMALLMILAQLGALLALGLAPFALIAAMVPGRGHDLFRGWGTFAITSIFISVAYALLLAVTMQVSIALTGGLSTIDMRLAIGLQAGLYWFIFLKRKSLARRAGSSQQMRVPVQYREHTKTVVATAAAPVAAVAGWATGRGSGSASSGDKGISSPPSPSTSPTSAASPVAPTAPPALSGPPVPPAYGGHVPQPGGPHAPQPLPPHAVSPTPPPVPPNGSLGDDAIRDGLSARDASTPSFRVIRRIPTGANTPAPPPAPSPLPRPEPED